MLAGSPETEDRKNVGSQPDKQRVRSRQPPISKVPPKELPHHVTVTRGLSEPEETRGSLIYQLPASVPQLAGVTSHPTP